MATAHITFNEAADIIVQRLEPQSRAIATAATFCEVGKVGGDLPLTIADAVAGFELLGSAKSSNEPGNIAGRRRTCGEVAQILRGPGNTVAGDPLRLAAVFRAVEQRFAGSADPREAAIAATAAREAAELES